MIRTAPLSLSLLLLPLAACAGARYERAVTVDEPSAEAEVRDAGATASPEEERLAALAVAPRRAPGDLFTVAFTPLEGNGELLLFGGTPLFVAYRDAFLGHAVVRPVDDVRVADAWRTAREGGEEAVRVPADVLVTATLTSADGVHTLEAEVRSAYDDAHASVRSSGDVLDLVYERFLFELEEALVDTVGPTLPTRSDHLRREPHLEAAHRRALERERAQG